MDITAYIYIEHEIKKSDVKNRILCFGCAVKETLKHKNRNDKFTLTLEAGDTGSGNDMRNTPECDGCHKIFADFHIA